ncbi:MAG TPA: DUF3078 domain-containing protein [Rhodothermales bacterium]|nr:DUF3078 domain-containing protein [Rhodothermales bacterium]
MPHRLQLLFFAAFIFLITPRLYAQEATPDSLLGIWRTEAMGQLAATQAGFQNWQGGGINTLAFSTGVKGKAKRGTERLEQVYQARFAFGLVKQDTLDFRKAEDLILLAATFQYKGDGFFKQFRPTVAADLRTQFAEGFNYDENPFEGEDAEDVPVQVSAFFAPATLTQSLGLTYQPADWITQRVGLGAKETIVRIERFRPLYGVDPDQTVRLEAGLEAFTEVDKEVFENVTYQSKLGLFAAFNQVDQPDALWENLITMKVNDWLNVSFEAVTLYDRDISKDVQIKEVLSLGVSFILL